MKFRVRIAVDTIEAGRPSPGFDDYLVVIVEARSVADAGRILSEGLQVLVGRGMQDARDGTTGSGE